MSNGLPLRHIALSPGYKPVPYGGILCNELASRGTAIGVGSQGPGDGRIGMALEQPAFDEQSDADTRIGRFVRIIPWLASEDDPGGVEDCPGAGCMALDPGVHLSQRREVQGVPLSEARLVRPV